MKGKLITILILTMFILSSCTYYESERQVDIEALFSDEKILENRRNFDFEKDDLYLIYREGKWGYIDKNGNVIIKPQFPEAWRFSEGLAVIEPQFTDAKIFSEGLAAVSLDGLYGFIDKEGNVVVDIIYEEVRDFNEGLAGVKLNGKWGYVNKSGEVVIDLKYDLCRDFNNGIARVMKIYGFLSYGWGYINSTGKEITNLIYETAYPFENGIAPVKDIGRIGYINMEGKYIWDPEWGSIVY